MSAPPTPLHAVEVEPVPEVVEILEDLLTRAREGEIIGIAVAAACDQHCTGLTFEIGDSNIADLYLAIERLKLRLLDYEGEP